MRFGTPLTPGAVKVMLLGAGELGKEVVIEAQRLGIETIACDRYPNAPAMQVASATPSLLVSGQGKSPGRSAASTA